MGNIEGRVQDHEVRIRTLEVSNAVLVEHVKQIRSFLGWGLTILVGTFLVQLINLVMK